MIRIIRPRIRGLPMALTAISMVLILGCEARVLTPETPQFPVELRQDLRVFVFDENDRPLPGATVTLFSRSAAGATAVASVTTDEDGLALFEEPEVGNYLVYAAKEGYVGSSTFAIVTRESAAANDLKLFPIFSLPDVASATVDPSGGTVATQPVEDIGQSSVTFPPGALDQSGTVTIATLSGPQIPVVPVDQVALSAVLVQVEGGDFVSAATVSLGLPFDIPDGMQIPVFTYDQLTNSWTQMAMGVSQNGQVVANIENLGAISALAGFIPRRTTIQPNIVVAERPLGPSDGEVIAVRWIPRLTFPPGTNYSLKTQRWIQSTIEQMLGLKIGEPVTTKITRNPNATQVLRILQRIDRYTLTVIFGTTGGKPARELRAAESLDFFGDVSSREAELRTIYHNSGFATAG